MLRIPFLRAKVWKKLETSQIQEIKSEVTSIEPIPKGIKLIMNIIQLPNIALICSSILFETLSKEFYYSNLILG